MSTNYALPFRTALPDDVQLGGWHYERDSDIPIRLGSEIAGWDYLTRLFFRREVVVSTERLLESCGLQKQSQILLTVTATSFQARYRETLFRHVLVNGQSSIVQIQFEADSRNLASQLQLETEIVLLKAYGNRRPLTAYLPGSRLYAEKTTVDLEGLSGRMPVQIADFGAEFGWLAAPRAPWFISCDVSDLSAPAMGVVKVYLNSAEKQFVEAAMRAEPAIVSLLGADASRRILLRALQEQEFIEASEEFEEGSFANVASQLLGACFPDRKPIDVKALAEKEGAKFDAAILSYMNVVPR